MKKHGFLSKSVVILASIGILASLFTGCQSKTAASNSSNKTTASTSQNSDQMKQKLQDDIKSLVTAGTINQSQADKIVEALTTRPEKTDGQGNGQGKGPGNGQGNGQGKQKNNQQKDQSSSGNTNSNNGSNGQDKKLGNPQLAKLVSDGTITQAQADAVMEKIKADFTPGNRGNKSQDNSSQKSSSNQS